MCLAFDNLWTALLCRYAQCLKGLFVSVVRGVSGCAIFHWYQPVWEGSHQCPILGHVTNQPLQTFGTVPFLIPMASGLELVVLLPPREHVATSGDILIIIGEQKILLWSTG